MVEMFISVTESGFWDSIISGIFLLLLHAAPVRDTLVKIELHLWNALQID